MKRILIALTVLITVASCDNIEDFNANPKAATDVPAGALLANAQKNLSDNLASTNVNTNVFRLLSQQWAQATYIDESNYDLATRNIPQSWWHSLYRDVLKDLGEAKTLVTSDGSLSDSEVKTKVAMLEITSVYTYSVLLTTFGNIPYFEALDYSIVTPVYDDASQIHNDLIKRLDAAIADLVGDAGDFNSYDLIFAGNIDSWKIFGYSLKLKLGMIIADSDPTSAKQVVEAAAPFVFNNAGESVVFNYLTSTPNTNPLWVDLVQSGRKDFLAANTIVDAMIDLNDPRIPMYFSTDAGGVNYTGAIYGSSNNYATYSKPGTFAFKESTENLLIDYCEIEFFLAEAVERGMNVGGTAEEHYNNAIKASLEYWGVQESEINSYLARTDVAYTTATGNYKQKIGIQKWIALYNRGFDAWTEWRRLDYPQLSAPTEAISDIPVRFPYPVSEQNLNTINYENAAQAVGGDKVSTKLYFDKF